jgi:hypothetical protein
LLAEAEVDQAVVVEEVLEDIKHLFLVVLK